MEPNRYDIITNPKQKDFWLSLNQIAHIDNNPIRKFRIDGKQKKLHPKINKIHCCANEQNYINNNRVNNYVLIFNMS